MRAIRNAVCLLAIGAAAQFFVGSPASASASAAPKKQIHEAWWQKSVTENEVGIYMWFYDRFHGQPSQWTGGTRAKPQG